MAEMKPQNPNMTHEEKVAIVDALMEKHDIHTPVVQMKSTLLAEALLVLGYGRNASTVNALRFLADMFESELPGAQPAQAMEVDLENLDIPGKAN